MCEPPYPVEGVPSEVPLGKSTRVASAVWVAEDVPMLPHTFAYIVRGALLGWLASMETARPASL